MVPYGAVPYGAVRYEIFYLRVLFYKFLAVAHAGGPRLSAAARSLPPLPPSTNYPGIEQPSRTHHYVLFVSTSDIIFSIKEHPCLLAAGDVSTFVLNNKTNIARA